MIFLIFDSNLFSSFRVTQLNTGRNGILIEVPLFLRLFLALPPPLTTLEHGFSLLNVMELPKALW